MGVRGRRSGRRSAVGGRPETATGRDACATTLELDMAAARAAGAEAAKMAALQWQGGGARQSAVSNGSRARRTRKAPKRIRGKDSGQARPTTATGENRE